MALPPVTLSTILLLPPWIHLLCCFSANDTHTPLSPNTSVLVYTSAYGLSLAWKVLLCPIPYYYWKKQSTFNVSSRGQPPITGSALSLTPDYTPLTTLYAPQPLRLPLTHIGKLMVGDYLFTNNQTRSSSRTNHGWFSSKFLSPEQSP